MQVPPSPLACVALQPGLHAGTKIYYDLKLQTADEREFIIARSLDDLHMSREIAACLNARLTNAA